MPIRERLDYGDQAMAPLRRSSSGSDIAPICRSVTTRWKQLLCAFDLLERTEATHCAGNLVTGAAGAETQFGRQESAGLVDQYYAARNGVVAGNEPFRTSCILRPGMSRMAPPESRGCEGVTTRETGGVRIK